MEILPHRPPMLLIDSAQRLVPGSECVASLYIDPAWHIFQGHFPGQPVLPGVYAVESMAQAADLLLLSQPRWAGKAPLLAGVEHARFKAKLRRGTRWRYMPPSSASGRSWPWPPARGRSSSPRRAGRPGGDHHRPALN